MPIVWLLCFGPLVPNRLLVMILKWRKEGVISHAHWSILKDKVLECDQSLLRAIGAFFDTDDKDAIVSAILQFTPAEDKEEEEEEEEEEEAEQQQQQQQRNAVPLPSSPLADKSNPALLTTEQASEIISRASLCMFLTMCRSVD
jgi:CO dehydrogenase/acetyl-CoA synthase beta subunit